MRKYVTAAAVLLVAGCAVREEQVATARSATPSLENTPPAINPAGRTDAPVPAATPQGFGWARSDGQRISGNAELTAKAHADIGACAAQSPPTSASGTRGEACMRSKGYYVRALD